MANLNGQNIGTNYKGIINIGSTINQNISAALQSLTDGDGNNLPIQVATGLVDIDGGTINFTTGTNTRSVLSHSYTINTTGGTNTVRGIFLNAIETSITGTTHNLMDLQVGGVSALTMSTTGLAIRGGTTTSHRILSVFNAANTAGWFTRAGDMVIQYQGYNYAIESVSSSGLMYFRPGAASGSVRISQGVGLVVGADVAPSARLHVRGDGTNPTTRFENSAGTVQFAIDNLGRTQIGEYQPYAAKLAVGGSDATFVIARTNGDSTIIFNASSTEIGQIRSISGTGLRLQTTPANTSAVLQGSVTTGAVYANRFTNSGNFTATSGEQGLANIAATFAAAAGSAIFRPLSINYTINNSGAQTGNITGYFLNATETNLNGITHNLMDLQVGGVSRFRIRGNGQVNMAALPTSSAGLSAGDLWNNGGVLNIV